MPSLTAENYLKAIYMIAHREADAEARVVTTNELAGSLEVTPGSVTSMLKSLAEAGLVTYVPYKGVELTEPGRRHALKVLRRHRLLEAFLVRTLEMSWDEVHEEAEHMEHVVSDRLIEKIDQFLGQPAFDPHGDPIPSADGAVRKAAGIPLTEVATGLPFRVTRVVEQDPAFLRYLSECGLDLETSGQVIQNRLEAGALSLNIDGRTLALGRDAAAKILVVAEAQPVP